MNNAFVVDAARTPRGRGKAGKGALSAVHPQELFAQVLLALQHRGTFKPGDLDDVIVGCVSQAQEQGSNIARNAVLLSGYPIGVSATTVNRFCGSGLQAINFAAMAVGSGAMQVALAGGVESMSRVPMGSDGGGMDGNNEALRELYFQVPQGISADLIATIDKISRGTIDDIAALSHANAVRAMEEGRFNRSIVPVVDRKTGATILAKDESPRPGTNQAGLAGLQPSFAGMGEALDPIALKAYPNVPKIEHVHTAGNSSGLADGAAAVVVASEDYIKAHGVKPRARIRAVATVGSEPVIMLTAPAPASEKSLKAAGMKASDIDLWEINEAFGAVVVQTIQKLGIDASKVNVNGGAIALGHPLGATGAILLGTALDELERSNKSTALVTMCIGGGQGIATILERV
jgi:acetyl-CoA C-acetyltransferase